MRRLRPGLAGLAVGLLLSAGAAQAQDPAPTQEAAKAAQAERDVVRARIDAERQAIQQRLGQQERACYQRFAVEDCLKEARTQARLEDNALRLQELKINDIERREKSAARLRSIEQKSQEPRSKAPVEGKTRGAALPGGAPAPARTAQDVANDQALHAQQARERAQTLSQRQQSHAAELARKQSTEVERRTAARERNEAKQRQAKEHKERQQAKAQDQADKKKPAPLPLPDAATVSP